MVSATARSLSRRYKAYFRWAHYPHKLRSNITMQTETDACPSVTSAFLQVGGRSRFAARPGAIVVGLTRKPRRICASPAS